MLQNISMTVAQINPVLGDLQNNRQRIETIWSAYEGQTDLIVFPEMVMCGYPVEDLIFRTSFLEVCQAELDHLIERSKEHSTAILVGLPLVRDGKVFNSAVMINRDKVQTTFKHELPNYGVFDEGRTFTKGPMPSCMEIAGHSLGIMICEDLWYPRVTEHLTQLGAQGLVVMNGSPFETGKAKRRQELCHERVSQAGVPLLYANLVGGQDELVFDGGSFVMQQDGTLTAQMPYFQEKISEVPARGNISAEEEDNLGQIERYHYSAAVLGMRDYVHKSGFHKVLLGLSGGIDSALTAVMAVDAFGKENVTCYRLSSPFTSQASMEDATRVAEALGVACETISILPAMKAFEQMIWNIDGLAHENMQARARGVSLMSLSNQNHAMLLSTGNKSELAVGYSTLYGDMCGGFNPLKDLYKTQVYALARQRNQWKPDTASGPCGPVIDPHIIEKAPSAELREHQKDEDSLPPYELLDTILERIIEQEQGVAEITAAGFDPEITSRVYSLVMRSEYKRRQAAPGPNLTTKSFGGRMRRYPMVNQF